MRGARHGDTTPTLATGIAPRPGARVSSLVAFNDPSSSRISIDRNQTQQPEIAQHLAGAENNRRERIIGD
jgi:hypothetical protein